MSIEPINRKKTTKKVKMPKKKASTKKITKKTTKVIEDEVIKDELIKAEYKYIAGKNEELIIDKPSTPLKNKKKIIKEIPKSTIQTNGQMYDAYIKELKNFKLVYNDVVLYDSTLTNDNSNLNFESDYFILFGKKYSYNGLRIQKII